MSQKVRSARGQILDVELLAIKQQLSSVPMPKKVQDRKKAIETHDMVKSPTETGFLDIANEAAEISQHATQLHRK